MPSERGDIIGYLVWRAEHGSEGPIWSTRETAQKFADTCRDGATYHEGAGYRVVVVSELPDGGPR